MTPAFFALLTVTAAADPALPAEWHGTWTGTLTVNALKPNSPTVPVTFELLPEKDGPAYRWRMTYDEGAKARVKDYRLVPGKTAGTFTLDEKNGIALETRLAGKVLVSTFEVGGNLLVSRNELRSETMLFEIQTFGKASETGGGAVPKVMNYPLIGVQSAEFRKK